ncbi:LOW QUALITY PROTEIN: ribosomal RNA processing protein 1 homolog [Phoenix dactylifera]|uniref:Ribosomal RNA processing protein 1 homolog n=1 Tax=Phoenix dactylifera TaxID=42345 RepID=A0A8B7CL66_PHODC|nr:ribosomal RNA processing protein 1 homolog [Phoenix dactylifera]XP_008801544.2 ribosomal RNA processing protein 1 homolog [Phoenix dactylifera]XP_008801545.2 ribosomal RNA processing protein 1 homolog [Phoenix dactylifera]XP_008801546.2 ribosomal RNA processing protein 1 homolog [Phoenix dactylifera]XP_008801547.2 ribosomal RNA processing protein 1 homolog [Phoenix dactylifera]XP_026663700.2 ribosomal RNA processing protein 1 homolog [Phoenix dactylifera]XP_026663701.2 ribosomal RNA proces
MVMEAPLSGTAIAKRLASCNKSTRDRAVRALTSWLPQQLDAAVSDGDLLKIWKGLFYCVWHSDKLPVQIDLTNRLAYLLEALAAPLAARYFEAFILTVRREWAGIDFLRLDKFYLLIRRFLRHLFLLLRKNAWDLDLSARLIGILSEKSLLAADKYPAQGVSYHFAEIFLDEIKEFLPLAVETLDVLLKPFLSVLEKSTDKVLANKIKVNVFERLLQNGVKLLDVEKAGNQVESGSDAEKFGKIPLVLSFSKRFFDSASASETLQGNRKVLFGLHEGFLKLEKDLEKSGVHISVQHLANGNSVKVPEPMFSDNSEQVDVDMGNGDGASDDQPLKKKKKKEKKKTKKALDGTQKKNKSKKKKSLDSTTEINDAKPLSELNDLANGGNINGDAAETHDLINFDECVISNLQKQFEKAAAEAGLANDGERLNALPAKLVTDTVPKKRKRAKSAEGKATVSGTDVNGDSIAGKSGEKSAKKVRFSMKSNLVWKPHSPLPPQSLRLPPSATPRGSALKKGIPPGPIKETPPTVKKIKVKANSVKKGRKISTVSSAVKHLRKLQRLSA